jgi:hypothetical protein
MTKYELILECNNNIRIIEGSGMIFDLFRIKTTAPSKFIRLWLLKTFPNDYYIGPIPEGILGGIRLNRGIALSIPQRYLYTE